MVSHNCNMAACFEASLARISPMPIPDGNRAAREAARFARTTTAACFADSLKVEPDDACAMRHPGIADDGRRPTEQTSLRRIPLTPVPASN